jgi:hypothetical protein
MGGGKRFFSSLVKRGRWRDANTHRDGGGATALALETAASTNT